jgi:hypothetical protein
MFLVQHGYQKGQKISDGLAAGRMDGVIWSPGDETPANLEAAIRDASTHGLPHQAVDPQVYVSTLQSANLKKLAQYGYFSPNLQPTDFSPRRISQIVQECLDFQASLDVTAIILPSIAVDSVGGRWAQIAANFLQAGIDDWGDRSDDRPILATAAVTGSLLSSEDEVNAFLDDLTSAEVDGYYLLLDIDPELGPPRYDDLIERGLWMTHSLAELNEFRVWAGYAGISGYVLRAAGAEGCGAGWWRKLNCWSLSHWLGGSGGRQPRPRVFLDTMLGSLLLVEELEPIYQADRALYNDIVAGAGPVAAQLRATNPAALVRDRDAEAAQLFEVCHELDRRLTGDFTNRARRVLDDISDAQQLHRRIRATGRTLEARSGPGKLVAWESAVRGVAGRMGINL